MTTTQTITATTLTHADRVRRQVAYMNGPSRSQIARARRLYADRRAAMLDADDRGDARTYEALAVLLWEMEDEFAPYGVTFETAV